MFLKIVISIVICLAAGFLGSFFTRSSLDPWYARIKKPSFNPPSWVFAPVWTVLYILMGVAAAIVWDKGFNVPDVRLALFVFLVQLALNALWSMVFFGRRSLRGGLIVITLLWLAILLTTVYFLGISKLAAILLLPYLVWVSFAVALNAAIVDLNK
jgi:tryptophan-rich sensory protein